MDLFEAHRQKMKAVRDLQAARAAVASATAEVARCVDRGPGAHVLEVHYGPSGGMVRVVRHHDPHTEPKLTGPDYYRRLEYKVPAEVSTYHLWRDRAKEAYELLRAAGGQDFLPESRGGFDPQWRFCHAHYDEELAEALKTLGD